LLKKPIAQTSLVRFVVDLLYCTTSCTADPQQIEKVEFERKVPSLFGLLMFNAILFVSAESLSVNASCSHWRNQTVGSIVTTSCQMNVSTCIEVFIYCQSDGRKRPGPIGYVGYIGHDSHRSMLTGKSIGWHVISIRARDGRTLWWWTAMSIFKRSLGNCSISHRRLLSSDYRISILGKSILWSRGFGLIHSRSTTVSDRWRRRLDS
jgi:hypothetical protein